MSRGKVSNFPFTCPRCKKTYSYTLNALKRAQQANLCHLCASLVKNEKSK